MSSNRYFLSVGVHSQSLCFIYIYYTSYIHIHIDQVQVISSSNVIIEYPLLNNLEYSHSLSSVSLCQISNNIIILIAQKNLFYPHYKYKPTKYKSSFDTLHFLNKFNLLSNIIQKEMDDFFSDITDQMIQARLNKMKEFLHQEHAQILNKIQDQSDYLFGFKRNNKINNYNCDDVQKSYTLFQRACQNILDTYFTLLCEDDFLALQSEQEIMDKMASLKSVIERNSSNLIKRLNKPKEEVEKEKKIKKDNKKKGKNSKIPLESTSIMQKWLLQNFHDPYPTQSKKQQMARQSKLSVYQVNNWFINARQRVIKRFLKKDIKQSFKNVSKSEQSEDSS